MATFDTFLSLCVVKYNNALYTETIPFHPVRIYLMDTKPNIPNTNYGIPWGGCR